MNYVLETDRLKLRELELEDAAFLIELLNSEGWLKYIGEKHVRTYEQAKVYLESGPWKSYRENGFGLYLAEKRDDCKAVGMCGILKRETMEHPEIGFAFLPAYNGKGYALEAARVTLSHAIEGLKLSTVCAIVMPENLKSRKLLENLGFLGSKRFRLPASNVDLLLYTYRTETN